MPKTVRKTLTSIKAVLYFVKNPATPIAAVAGRINETRDKQAGQAGTTTASKAPNPPEVADLVCVEISQVLFLKWKICRVKSNAMEAANIT